MHILTLQENEEVLAQLLTDYKLYSQLESQLKTDTKSVKNGVIHLKMQHISDRMKYPNPRIWILYKTIAYRNLPNRIITIEDLKNHCKPVTHICHQRFDFLTNILKKEYSLDVFDGRFHTKNVMDVITSDILLDISQNETFMQQRWKYEYYSENGKIMKWKNYRHISE